jgi:hypothetical protein
MKKADRKRYIRRAGWRMLPLVAAGAVALALDWQFDSTLATTVLFYGLAAWGLYRLWQRERGRRWW